MNANNLTRREEEVLELLAAGHTTREVAAELCISKSTVKRHVENILSALSAPNRTAAVALWKDMTKMGRLANGARELNERQ
jgi:DNA-binding NarL/FixJ family response regulator